MSQIRAAKLSNEHPTEWITPTELATEWKMPVQTLYRWRSERKGPIGRSVGRQVRYSREDVNAWLEANADAWGK